MRTKHTPKPWSINNSMAGDKAKSVFWYIITDDVGKTIAEVKGKHCGIQNDVAEVNAKLIAAAPELLEALKIFVANGFQIPGSHAMKVAKNAIQKVTS